MTAFLPLHFEFTGGEQVTLGIVNIQQFLDDMTPFWVLVSGDLQMMMLEEFAYEGDVGNLGPWADLDKKYAAWKARAYPGQTILRLTDRMYDSLVGTTDDTVFTANPTWMAWGTGVEYARYHQEGTEHMPARPLFREDILTETLVRSSANAARAMGLMFSGVSPEDALSVAAQGEG